MNTHRNRLLRSIVAFLPGALILAMTLLTGCDKSDRTAGIVDLPDTNTQYTLLPPAISIEPFGGGSSATRAALVMKEERQAFNTGEELGNIITLGNSEAEDTPQTRAFTNGTYYRIVVYKLSEYNAASPKIHSQRLCKTGQTAYAADKGDSTEPICLDPDDYRVFVYSFNKTTADKLDKLADGAVNVPISEGDDFLSSDIISKNIADSQLGTNVALGTITLKHRCCRLTGTLTAEAFEATGIADSPTPSLSVTSTFNSAGSWSIKSSTFIGSATSSVEKAIPLSKSGDTYTGTVFLLPLSGKSLTTSYTFKPNGASQNITASNKSISSSATFSGGGSYSFTIKAVGAYVITEGVESLKIGSYTWATRNCRWNNTFETNLDIWNSGNLRGTSKGTSSGATTGSDYNSYFNWGMKTPGTSYYSYSTADSWPSDANPCPSGYSVPSSTHFKDLVKKIVPKGKKVSINGEVFTIDNAYGFYNGSKARGMVLIDGGNTLFLPAAGYRDATKWYEVGSNGGYWSSTPNGSSAYRLYFSRGSINPENNSARNYGWSVRCVK